MSRKLMILNVALVALIIAGLWRLSATIGAAEEREATRLGQPLKPVDVPPEPAVERPSPIFGSDYITVADKVLFFEDRNPNVEIVAVAPKPLPPLPTAHGVLDIGSGPTIILSEDAKSQQKAYRVGDQFGPFTIAAISNKDVVFDWEGERVRRTIDELRPDEGEEPVIATSASKPKSKPKPGGGVLGAGEKPGPSEIDMGGGVMACRPGDNSPAGTVVSGYKKVMTQTPFGSACRWEAVQ